MNRMGICLWFNTQAEEAAKHYVSVFKNSKINTTVRYGEAAAKASGQKKGGVMIVALQIDGLNVLAFNGGQIFKLSPATSVVVECDTQEEIDRIWKRLSAVKEAEQCGWLQDKFGVSWQIVPKALGEMMQTKDKKQAERVMAAMMPMKKIDVQKLRDAYIGV